MARAGTARSGGGMRSLLAALALGLYVADTPAANELRFDVAVLPAFQRHAALLEQPGYAAVALENIGLSLSLSSKLMVKDHGRILETRYGTLRFAGRKGAAYSYEAVIFAGLGDSGPRIVVPVALDAASLGKGTLALTLKPPLAALIPDQIKDRIEVKLRLIANAGAQRRTLEYLDRLVKQSAGGGTLAEEILQDSYNRNMGPAATGSLEAGDALPLSQQWMLILTVLIWLVAVPALVFYRVYRWKKGRKA
jgi:hypothetical protein